jgi:hypothetical protein
MQKIRRSVGKRPKHWQPPDSPQIRTARRPHVAARPAKATQPHCSSETPRSSSHRPTLRDRKKLRGRDRAKLRLSAAPSHRQTQSHLHRRQTQPRARKPHRPGQSKKVAQQHRLTTSPPTAYNPTRYTPAAAHSGKTTARLMPNRRTGRTAGLSGFIPHAPVAAPVQHQPSRATWHVRPFGQSLLDDVIHDRRTAPDNRAHAATTSRCGPGRVRS